MELIRSDHQAFIRHGIAQSTGGSIGGDLAQRMIARVSLDLLVSRWEAITGEEEDIGALLARVECPPLFAKHMDRPLLRCAREALVPLPETRRCGGPCRSLENR
jgi:hypothetical protein